MPKRREPDAWRNDPATQNQINYLREAGIRMPWKMMKGQAHLLIEGEPVTKKQLRRLKFYKIRPPKYLTKKDAMDLIDGYIAAHPDSEAAYQAWKRRKGYYKAILILIVVVIVWILLSRTFR